jgi:uncharacterized protein YndB with AHSA1/START domain
MITRLEADAPTDHAWNGRDDNHHHHHGKIPLKEKPVSISLTWRKEKSAKPVPVGPFLLNMEALAKAGFVRKLKDHYRLRFQRTDRVIEISQNRASPARLLGPLPKSY